jgi:hypothetical protein
VHPAQQSGLIELAQVTADRVGGDVELVEQVRSQHPALDTKVLEDHGSAFVGEHRCTIIYVYQ